MLLAGARIGAGSAVVAAKGEDDGTPGKLAWRTAIEGNDEAPKCDDVMHYATRAVCRISHAPKNSA